MPQDSNELLLEAILENGDKHAKDNTELLEALIVQAGNNGTVDLLEAQLINDDKNSKAITAKLQELVDKVVPVPKDFPEADFKETNTLLKELLEEAKKKEEFEVSISAEDRLKLKGDKGEPGKDGKDAKGIDGTDGLDGKSIKGDKGEPGKDGKGISIIEITVLEKKIKKAVRDDNNLLWVNNGAVRTLTAGANIVITGDPQNPIISASGGGSGGAGDVAGPASSVNNRVVLFDGITGKLIKDSGLTLSGTNTGDQDLSGKENVGVAATADTAHLSNFAHGDIAHSNRAALDLVAGTNTGDNATNSQYTVNPMTTGGDIIYGGASGIQTRLANGLLGTILTSNGTTLPPTWNASTATGISGYSETSFTAQTSIVVTHNFGARPVVTVIDDTGAVVVPLSITHASVNAFTVVFTASTTGNIQASVGAPPSPSLVQKTGLYTITSSDYTIECISGTYAVTLPTAVGISGKIYNIKNSGTGVITVDGSGSEPIDGALTVVLSTQYESITVQSNGTNFIIL